MLKEATVVQVSEYELHYRTLDLDHDTIIPGTSHDQDHDTGTWYEGTK